MPGIGGEKCLLVKTASEIALKSNYVRRFFTKKLVRNIKFALKKNRIGCNRVVRGGGRLFLFTRFPKKAQRALSLVSGIHSTAVAQCFKKADYAHLEKETVSFAKKNLKKGDSFALDARVVNNRNFSSRSLEARLGAAVQEAIPGLEVDLEQPGKEIFIEVRKSDFFIYAGEKEGIGGLPTGVEGSVALLVSGKRKELLAGFLMLRRGCNVFPVAEKAGPKMERFVEKLVPLNNYRSFVLTEEKGLENLVKERKIRALVTGDSAVDARSLESYKQFDEKQSLVVLRPLPLYPAELRKKAESLFR